MWFHLVYLLQIGVPVQFSSRSRTEPLDCGGIPVQKISFGPLGKLADHSKL